MSRCASLVEPLRWVEVSPACPCRVCGAVSACTLLECGEFVLCRRTISEWPMLDGGWLHRFLHRPPEALEHAQERQAAVL
jgi:hypothetical protein